MSRYGYLFCLGPADASVTIYFGSRFCFQKAA